MFSLSGAKAIRSPSAGASRETPLHAACRGATAGMAATALLSVLSRALPGLNNQPAKQKPKSKPQPPQDPSDRRQVEEWQTRSWSPAAYQERQSSPTQSTLPGITPASALEQPVSPGPEGLAEQFAFKFASGIFDRDISPYVRPAGKAVHLAYGSWWGVLYGLLQASYCRPPLPGGALYGFMVYLVGPAFLVPAMKLLRPPAEEPPLRTAMLIAGHIAYGAALAGVFKRLQRKEQ